MTNSVQVRGGLNVDANNNKQRRSVRKLGRKLMKSMRSISNALKIAEKKK